MGETPLGRDIIWARYDTASVDHQYLAQKYADELHHSEDIRMLIRNVRRRLYDAVNVFISAGIVSKGRMQLRLVNREAESVRVKKEEEDWNLKI